MEKMADKILEYSDNFFMKISSPTINNLLKNTSSPKEICHDAKSTRILISRPTITLIRDFLALQTHAIYKNMTVKSFIKRLVTKRPLMFCGRQDSTITRNLDKLDHNACEVIGTRKENPKLSIYDYLSYDEILISALIGVSSYTRFINSGSRYNRGIIDETGMFIKRGVVVGLVGCRFERFGGQVNN
jgi:hypothetical protein